MNAPQINDEPIGTLETKAEQQVAPATTEAGAFLDQAKEMSVTTEAAAASAASIAKTISDRSKHFEKQRKAITVPMDEAKKRVMDLFRVPVDTLNEATKIIRGKVTGYQLEVEKKAKAEQARLDEVARKEREKLERRAEAAAEKGQTEKAEELQERAETVVVHQAIAPKVAGATVTKTWVAEVTDIKALCKAIGDGAAVETLVTPAQSEINQFARATKGKAAIPGIRFYQKSSSSFR